jgi:hypothetical protein
MKKLMITMIVLALTAVLGMTWCFAKETREKDPMAEKQAVAKAAKISMAAALETATKEIKGTVVNAELENENDKIIFSFEILPTPDSKIIKEVQVDAVTGVLIGVEDENAKKEADEKAKDSKEVKKSEKHQKGEKYEKSSKEKGEKDEANEKDEKNEKDND